MGRQKKKAINGSSGLIHDPVEGSSENQCVTYRLAVDSDLAVSNELTSSIDTGSKV